MSDDLEVPQHVLRFWETKFSQVRPLKRGGGRRYYRPEDVDLLRRIQKLLYQDGYTIKGVQRLLREGRADAAGPANDEDGEGDLFAASETQTGDAGDQNGSGGGEALSAEVRAMLTGLLTDLRKLREALSSHG